MDDSTNPLAVSGNGQFAFGIKENNFVEWRLFVPFDQDTIALFQGVGDRTLLEVIIGQNPKVGGIVDRNNSRSSLTETRCVFARLIHFEPVRIVLVVTYPNTFIAKAAGKSLNQRGFAHTRKPGKTQKRGFELFPVTVHRPVKKLNRNQENSAQGENPAKIR